MKKSFVYMIGMLWIIVMSACQSTPKKPFNYRPFLKHMPASILVLPPVNESMEVMAPYMYISTISRPIAEKGYYVFPVAVIDALMKANGVSTPEDMHRIPLIKINEIIGPDAVLYVTIKEWGTKYRVLDSQTVVYAYAKLIDTDTGSIIWQNASKVVKSSNDGSNSIIQMLLAALINQVLSNFFDPTLDVAHVMNQRLYNNAAKGLLKGKYHPEYELSQKEVYDRMKLIK